MISRSSSLRIGYDAYSLLTPNKGSGKGLQLRNLISTGSRGFIAFAPPGPLNPDFPVIRRGSRRYILWQQFSLPGLIRSADLDYFLAPSNTAPFFVPRKTKLIVVLHDLIPFSPFPSKDLELRMRLRLWRLLIRRAVSRAHVVLTVSQYSRNEILSLFPKANVVVVPCSIPISWFRAPFDVVEIGNRGGYFLLVTSTEPHRNVERFLQAYAQYVDQLGARALRLRIAGVANRASLIQPMAERFSIEKQVTIEPYLSEAEMQSLIANADGVCMPSLAEGFGIPVLEGMSSGTPVLCSNVTSMPEVGGDAPEYFDPYDTNSMKEALIRVSESTDRRAKMISAGLARSRAFHPDVVGLEIRRFWDSLEEEGLKSA
jgi:glycosyltransferase involved in cell wall biosynthesis